MQNVTNIIRVGNVDAERMVNSLMEEGVIKGLRDWHIRLLRGKLLDGGEGYLFLAGHAEIWEMKTLLPLPGRAGEKRKWPLILLVQLVSTPPSLRILTVRKSAKERILMP
jgi:hypothetical protein